MPPFLGRRRGWARDRTGGAVRSAHSALAGVARHPGSPWVIAALALAIAVRRGNARHRGRRLRRGRSQAGRARGRGRLPHGVLPDGDEARRRLRDHVRFLVVVADRLSCLIAACLHPAHRSPRRSAPKPEEAHEPPRSLRDAVWQPFVGFLSRPFALQILAFVILYKLSDVMADALLRPFLHDMGYNQTDRGVLVGVGRRGSTGLGALAGGIADHGLGRRPRALGVRDHSVVVEHRLHRRGREPGQPVADARGHRLRDLRFGHGDRGVLRAALLRLTQKRFSATQYSLMSSLFALPRIFSGPVAGIPRRRDRMGRLLLGRRRRRDSRTRASCRRFAPIGGQEPDLRAGRERARASLSRRGCS